MTFHWAIIMLEIDEMFLLPFALIDFVKNCDTCAVCDVHIAPAHFRILHDLLFVMNHE